MKKYLVGILFVIIAWMWVAGQQLPIDPELRHGTLPNGLTYYIRHNATPASRAEFWLIHKVGSVMEEEDERGLAHFLEHMAFTGTKNFSDYQLFGYLTSYGLAFGTDVNATTSYDDTQYYISNVPTMRQSMLDSVLYIMRDLSCNLTLDSLQIDKERAIIDEERTSNSTFQLRLQEQALPVLMAGSRYAHRIPIGLPQVVAQATRAQLLQFYHRWYRPDRQALIIVGDVDAALIERKVKRIFGVMPTPVELAPVVDLSLPDHKGLRVVCIADADADATMVNLYFKHDDLPADQLNTMSCIRRNMSRALAISMLNTRLERLTRQAQSPLQYARANDSHFIATRSKEALTVTAIAQHGQVDATLRLLLTEARRATLHGFTTAEIGQAKAALSAELRQYALQVGQHTSQDYVTEYVDHYLSGGYIPGVTQEVELSLAVINQLTTQDLNALPQQWIGLDNACLMIAGPDDEQLPSEAACQALFNKVMTSEVDALDDQPIVSAQLMSTQPAAGKIANRQVDQELQVTRLTLSNGAQVLLLPTKNKAGEIMFDAIAPGGRWACDERRAVQLKVLEEIIEESRLGGHTQEQLRGMLADKQLALSFTLGDDYHDLQGGCATADLETLMQAVHLYFTDVTPDTATFAQVIERLRSQVTQRQGRPEAMLADSTITAHFGHQPQMLPPTLHELDQLNADSVLALYRDYVAAPERFTFIIVGDFDMDTVERLIERYIASLPTGGDGASSMTINPINLVPGTRQVVVPAGETNQRAQVRVTLSGMMEETLVNEMMTACYGRMMEVALNSVLREQEQLTYGVSASAQLLRTEPRWMLQYNFACKPQDVDNAIVIAQQAVKLLQERGAAPQLFDKVKQMMLRRHDEDLATNAYWMNVLRNRVMHHDIHTGVDELLRSFTIDEFDDFVTQLFPDTHITICTQ